MLVDALRYDFTVPVASPPPGQPTRHFHNALPVLHETAAREPHRALLRPFIADPPTTTLQRLKGLTTGTLPTFIEAGSNFAGTAIDEDNLIEQLFLAGKRVVHLGDDTWHALFPGCFDANLTRAYDSFNVWDLHTLDDGVTQHLFPLLAPPMARRWDVVVAHYLGVDHAGHRYGPDHPAMRDKLRQMDAVLRRLMHALDDDTLLVVMGDHGMDAKGDHGGESDDEVEAALWMYAKRGIFGRSDPAFATPPATAKHRPVSQIDLVPTLAYLLGLPVPFNNLGQPIEEAFLGPHGTDHENLARVSHMTAAQIQRYQAQYALARPSDASIAAPVHQLWRSAASTWQHVSSAPAPAPPASWRSAHTASAAFQAAHLRICKDQWARFDLPSMALGLLGLLSTLAVLALYAQGLQADAAAAALAPALVLWGVGAAATAALAAASLAALAARPVARPAAFAAVQAGCAAALFVMSRSRPAPRLPFPRTPSGALSALATLLLCAALASNSYTIWEDRQLLFLLATFAAFLLAASFALPDPAARRTGVAHALAFLAATRLASLSRLCRDEQAPLCASTFYASPHSSTSAPWQTALPFAITLLLPPALRAFFARADSYHGSAVLWLGRALPAGLALVALHWLLDAADDANWYPAWPPETLKNARVVLAQLVLALAAAAGYATYIWAAPLLLVHERGPRILVFGYANAHAARYFLLLPIWHLALSLLQKPTAQAALALLTLSITHLLTVLSATGLAATDSPLGPTALALLAAFHFYTTGHQPVLPALQWSAAFIPLRALHPVPSALLICANTLAPHILCALAAPAAALWGRACPPPRPRLLARAARAAATLLLVHAALATAAVAATAWLRRHLMLSRVFLPRMLFALAVLLAVELVLALLALGGAALECGECGGVAGVAGGGV